MSAPVTEQTQTTDGGRPDAMRLIEVARQLGAGRKSISRAIHLKELKAFRLGRRWYVPRSEMEHVLAPAAA